MLRAGAGQPHFVRGADLRRYVGSTLVRIFAVACLTDELVRTGIAARHPNARFPMRGGVLLTPGEIDLPTNDLVACSGLGTFLATMGPESHSALEFFMEAGEADGAEGG